MYLFKEPQKSLLIKDKHDLRPYFKTRGCFSKNIKPFSTHMGPFSNTTGRALFVLAGLIHYHVQTV